MTSSPQFLLTRGIQHPLNEFWNCRYSLARMIARSPDSTSTCRLWLSSDAMSLMGVVLTAWVSMCRCLPSQSAVTQWTGKATSVWSARVVLLLNA